MRLFLFLLLVIVTVAATAQKTRLNHLALPVSDLQKSTRFYQHIIGLDTLPEPFHDGRHTWFSLGVHAQLHLIGGGQAGGEKSKAAHLCFSVPSIQAFITRLNKEEILFEDWAGKQATITKRPDGVQQIYFRDPDGYWIEVNDAAQ